MNEKLKIKDFMRIIKKRLLIIILTAICITGFIIFSSLYIMKPTYQYSTQVLAGSLSMDEKETSINKVQENRQLALSYMDIIKSPQIMIGVKKELALKASSYDLLKQISITNRDNSQIITISVKDSDPETAKAIAQTVAMQSISKFKDITRVKQISILNDNEMGQAELLFPKPKFIIAISIVIGIFAGMGLALLREHFDDSTYTDRELERLGIPILGRLNLNDKKTNRKRKSSYKTLPSAKRGEFGEY
ncbi:capsule biosynthesis protein CapK [Peribacillus simplex]|uniref:Capsule biosynthesis protein CapK n=1 Tax=Peribacillus simplex TaxID=1478 RepID=A0A120GND1_9BACI|nr:Wzz/FepE/Etk N-terminal domain-containing protein [Peribacillus simplex]KWW14044.1 capsule biosynthesis protein CapK [Peribacillus simplex]